MDILTATAALLHSVWLLPVLALLIAADGPLPMLPTETLLMSAAALAFGTSDVLFVLGLFVAATIGSASGDLCVFALGRTSNRIVSPATSQSPIALWVRKHLLSRPGVALIGARFVPAGRLVSTAAAGRFGLELPRFVGWSLTSSALWAIYMLLIGLALGPVTGGHPLLCLLAGAVMAALTAGVFALARRYQRYRSDRAAASLAAEGLVTLTPVRVEHSALRR